MGTQNAWEGSGGRDWGRLRDESGDLLDNPSAANAEALLPALSDALNWLGEGGEVPSQDEPQIDDEMGPTLTPLPAGPSWHPPAGRGTGGGPGGGGGAGVGAGRQTGGRGSGGGRGSRGTTGRSRARAASVGGRVLSAGLAYRRGDAETLRSLGLDLDELRSLSGLRRANAILNAVVGADGGIEETELRKVNARVLREVLTTGLDGIAAVRLYIVEYVMQVWSSETGEAMRNGSRPASASRDAQRQLRDALMARARQLEVAPSSTATELRRAISRSLGLMRRLMKGT
ncbi:hypothetical protein BH18ACT13_BH18ACT13_08130 [soil metagenome]